MSFIKYTHYVYKILAVFKNGMYCSEGSNFILL
jgi:hypothetical protein